MNTRGAPLKLSILIVLAILGLAGAGWVNYLLASQGLGGRAFVVQYTAMRGLLMEKANPYDSSIAQQAGERLEAAWQGQNEVDLRYTSPLFSSILVLPFAAVADPLLAQALWMTLQQAAAVAIILVSMSLARWQPPRWVFFVFALLTILAYHGLGMFAEGGMVVWAALFWVLTLALLRAQRFELAGGVLALAFVDPPVVLPGVILVLLWTVGRKKWAVLAWFLGVLILLSVIGEFLAPGWILQYLQLVWKFSENFGGANPGQIFQIWWPALGTALGWVLSGLLALVLLLEWWLVKPRDFRWFLWTACLTLAVTPWLGIPTRVQNFAVLWPSLVLLAAVLQERWEKIGRWATPAILLILLVWEWSSVVRLLSDPQPTTALSLIFPLPFMLLVSLFWVRWWAVRPPRLMVEELRSLEND